MSMQRRRGMPIKVWKRKETTDRRGNVTLAADLSQPADYELRAWAIPERSSRAEVPGQQQIDVIRMGIDPHVEDVGVWAIVQHDNDYWDVVSPPAYHHGTRHTRHYSVMLRRRP